jgi:DNA polymerase/3'-5' exonuclease PolX
MNLQKDYEELYEHWLKEFQQVDLTEMNQDLFSQFKTTMDFINDYQEIDTIALKMSILKSYKENISFLFTDLLKIRKLKITNSALALKEINLNNVFEAEKLLYENLVSSVKGYNKVKAISLYNEEPPQINKTIQPDLEMKSIIEERTLLKKTCSTS